MARWNAWIEGGRWRLSAEPSRATPRHAIQRRFESPRDPSRPLASPIGFRRATGHTLANRVEDPRHGRGLSPSQQEVGNDRVGIHVELVDGQSLILLGTPAQQPPGSVIAPIAAPDQGPASLESTVERTLPDPRDGVEAAQGEGQIDEGVTDGHVTVPARELAALHTGQELLIVATVPQYGPDLLRRRVDQAAGAQRDAAASGRLLLEVDDPPFPKRRLPTVAERRDGIVDLVRRRRPKRRCGEE